MRILRLILIIGVIYSCSNDFKNKGFIVVEAQTNSISSKEIKVYPKYLDSIITDYGLKKYNDTFNIVSVRYSPVFIEKSPNVQEEVLDTNTYIVKAKGDVLRDKIFEVYIDKKTKIIVYHHENKNR